MSEERFMRRALELAERGRYTVSPNPMVGCVIVRDGEIIGEGFHRRAGEPHAEIEAMRAAKGDVGGADFYVTLEPCAHYGRTPPCAEALVAARPSRVIVATGDPHQNVAGKGIAALEEAGIQVEVGLLEDEAERQNERFLHTARTNSPFVLLKAGMTLDGKLATVDRSSQWITSPESRERSLALREEFDAILVGSGTVRADDPQLSRRLGLNDGATPWTRIVLDGEGELPGDAGVLTDGSPTIVFTTDAALEPRSSAVEIVRLTGTGGLFDLESIFSALWDRGIQSVIVEGGSLVHSSLIEKGLWQKMMLFIAPMIVGGGEAPSIFGGSPIARLTDAYRFRFDHVERLGPDLLLVAYPLSDSLQPS
jgi:diaminohydroxyphosphoribosylaminopyrimidine deaminase / 5-amino-6-(5-phosphoribosylamino)uracil reductase